MSNSDAPDQNPKTQPKWSGGPPRPPKITARGLEDGVPNDPDPLANLIRTETQIDRLMELLESIRGSRLVALNRLEADLDACVVQLSKLLDGLTPEMHGTAMWRLRTIGEYRHKHPRLETGDREMREQARRVLDEIKKGDV